MNEAITKPENHPPTPPAHVPDPPYTQAQDAQGRPMTGRETEHSTGRGEPLTRTERLLVTMFVTMFATMVATGALGFTTLSGQLLDMQKQIGALRTEMHEEIGNLSERMARVEEQVARVEEQVARVEERLTGIESFIRTHHGPPAGP